MCAACGDGRVVRGALCAVRCVLRVVWCALCVVRAVCCVRCVCCVDCAWCCVLCVVRGVLRVLCVARGVGSVVRGVWRAVLGVIFLAPPRPFLAALLGVLGAPTGALRPSRQLSGPL
eukprot:1643225-Pyramimonas_sp.AAC.1